MTSGPTLPPGLRQLGSALADALDNLTTRAIGLDPVALARIAALDGRVLAIEAIVPAWPGLKPGALRFTLTFEQQALRVRPGTAHEPDAHARVRGPLPTLIGWLTSPKATLAPDLELEGDLQLIEAVGALAGDYRPDWTSPVGRFVGPAVASTVLNALDAASAGFGLVRNLLRDTAADGARQVFSDRTLATAFLDELDALRADVDRLAARIDLAESRSVHQKPAAVAPDDSAGRPMP